MSWTRTSSGALRALCILVVLSGCASPQPLEPYRYAFDERQGTFAPTRLAINRNLPLSPRYLDRLDAVAEALAGSRAFTAFGPAIESRYVLDLTLERMTDDFTSMSAGGGGYHGGVGVAVPVTGGRHTHRLTAVVYLDGESTHAYRYVGDFESPWRMSGDARLPRQGPEDVLISNLVNHLVRDLDRDDAIERVGTGAR